MTTKGSKKQSKNFINSLINELYKGSSNDIAQKSSMQYLGRINGTNRLPPPVWLPSKKAELCGQNPDINIVPVGTSGWGAVAKPTTTPPNQTVKSDQLEVEKNNDSERVEKNETSITGIKMKSVPLKPFFQQPKETPDQTEEIKPSSTEKISEIITNPKGASEIVGKISGWAAVNEEPDFDEQLVFSGEEDNSFEKQFSSNEEDDEVIVNTSNDMKKSDEHNSFSDNISEVKQTYESNEASNNHDNFKSESSCLDMNYHHNLNQPPPHQQPSYTGFQILADNHLLHQHEMFDNSSFDAPSGNIQDYGLVKKRDERTQDFNNAIEKAHKNRRKPNPGLYGPVEPQNDNHHQFNQKNQSFDYNNRYQLNRPSILSKKDDANIWSGSHGTVDMNNRLENPTKKINILKHDPHEQFKMHDYNNKFQPNPQALQQPLPTAIQQQAEIKILSKPSNNKPNDIPFDRNSLTNVSNVSSMDKFSLNNQPGVNKKSAIQPLMEINAQPASEHLNFLWEDKFETNRISRNKPSTYTNNIRSNNSSTNHVSRAGSKSYSYSTKKNNYVKSDIDTSNKDAIQTNQSSYIGGKSVNLRFQNNNVNRSIANENGSVKNNHYYNNKNRNWNNEECNGENNSTNQKDGSSGAGNKPVREDTHPDQEEGPTEEDNTPGNNNPGGRKPFKSFQRKNKNIPYQNSSANAIGGSEENPRNPNNYVNSRGGGRRGAFRGSSHRRTNYQNDSHEYYRMSQNQSKNFNNPDDKSDGGGGTMGSNQNSSSFFSQNGQTTNGSNQNNQQNRNSKQNFQSTGSKDKDNNSDVDEWETATEGSVSDRLHNGQHFDNIDQEKNDHKGETAYDENQQVGSHTNIKNGRDINYSTYRGGHYTRGDYRNNNFRDYRRGGSKFIQKDSGFRHVRHHLGPNNIEHENSENNRYFKQNEGQNFQKRDGRKPWKLGGRNGDLRRKLNSKSNRETDRDSSKAPEDSTEINNLDVDEKEKNMQDTYNSFDSDCDTNSDVGFVEVVPKSLKRKQKLNEKKRLNKTMAKTKSSSAKTKPDVNIKKSHQGNIKSKIEPKVSENKKIELNVSKEAIKKAMNGEAQVKRINTSVLKPATDAWKKPSLTVKAIFGDKKAKAPNEKSKNESEENVKAKSENSNSTSWSKAVGSRLNKNSANVDNNGSNASKKQTSYLPTSNSTKLDESSSKAMVKVCEISKNDSISSSTAIEDNKSLIKSLWNQQSTEVKMDMNEKTQQRSTNGVPDNFHSSDDECLTKSSNSSKTDSLLKDNSLSIVSTSNNVCKVKPQQHPSQQTHQMQNISLESLHAPVNKVKLLQGSRNFSSSQDSKASWKTDSGINLNPMMPETAYPTKPQEQHHHQGQNLPMTRDSNVTKFTALYNNLLSFQDSQTQPAQPQHPQQQHLEMFPQSPVSNGQGRQLFHQPNFGPQDLFGYNESQLFQNANIQQLRGLYPTQPNSDPANLMTTSAHAYQGPRQKSHPHQASGYDNSGKWHHHHHGSSHRTNQQYQHHQRVEELMMLSSQNSNIYNTPGLSDKLIARNANSLTAGPNNSHLSSNPHSAIIKSLSNSGNNFSILSHQMYSHHQKGNHVSQNSANSDIGHNQAMFPNCPPHHRQRSNPPTGPVNVHQPPPPLHGPLALAAMDHHPSPGSTPFALYTPNESSITPSEDIILSRHAAINNNRFNPNHQNNNGNGHIFHQPPPHLPMPSPNNPHNLYQQNPYQSNNGPWKFPHATTQ